ncbi:helix-turn-helix transcriptional regulator [Xanthomonas campestris pv. badrii]|uniref:Helix-turn-helix transcriptional regulator n=1 Tax=Xanthomonas campestris pv. badrii TaxID=149696 RepID=A0A7Z2ZJE6_XANCA|nr:helix-turn-helix transcriptional regulator [Xanthomonas campestris]QJD70032.1 helix-turn-helix transcriptional regulator [Xanthomonas campestris pv. badrii]
MARLIATGRPDLLTGAVTSSHASRARAVARALHYIETHLCEPIGVAQLAGAACMSRFHFARVFRDAVGASPMQYLRRRRLECAQAMLREGRHTISQIATNLCFFDQSHFVRSFRNATGCTPARFAAQVAVDRSLAAPAPRVHRHNAHPFSTSLEHYA